MKEFRNLQQVNKYREFHIFWFEFQRLFNELKFFEKLLLNEIRNKMSWKLQKQLTVEIYKVIDLYEFARLCMHIDQILRDVKAKSRAYRRNLDIENVSSESTQSETDVITFVSTFSTSEDISLIKSISSRIWSFSISRSEISFASTSRLAHLILAVKQKMKKSKCFNCDESDHMTKNCSHSKKTINELFLHDDSKKNTSST